MNKNVNEIFIGNYLRVLFKKEKLDVLVLLEDFINPDLFNSYELYTLSAYIECAVHDGCQTEEEFTEVLNSLITKNDQDGLGLEFLADGFTVIVRPIIK